MAATDGTLVLGVLSGDRAAFAELYDRRARLIRAVCLDATGDVDAAADLTQEVFMRAYHRLASLQDPQRFGPWLVGIARLVCLEWRRGKLQDRRRLAEFPRMPMASEDEAPADDDSAALRRAIGSLPEKERCALHAFYLQEQDVEQARSTLGLSRSGFYHVLNMARQRLKRILTHRGMRA